MNKEDVHNAFIGIFLALTCNLIAYAAYDRKLIQMIMFALNFAGSLEYVLKLHITK